MSLKLWFSLGDVTYPHTDQNGISDKSAKNAPTSPKTNFFENGRVRLVYDSFWPQGPPKLQKIGLGWFPPFVRHPRTDLRFFSDFSRISSWDVGPRKQIFQPVESEKNVRNFIFSIFMNFLKNYDTLAPFWYIHIDRTPNIRGAWVFWKQSGHFSQLIGLSLFWKPLRCLEHHRQ